MRVAVGSMSESKLRAARAVCARAFPGAVVEGIDVSSGVAAQPTNQDDTIRGARRRAREAQRILDADLGIGIEGGIFQDAYGAWLCAWAAVVERSGRETLASGIRFPLPAWMADRALRGEELGAVVDASLGEGDAHETLGAIGLLTNGLLDRQAALEQALTAALAPVLASSLYGGETPRKASTEHEA